MRIGDAGTSDPPTPTQIRIGTSTGAAKEAPVEVWVGGGLPPIGDASYLKDFTTRYMDPTEVYGRFKELAAEFPNISELITLPNKLGELQIVVDAFDQDPHISTRLHARAVAVFVGRTVEAFEHI